MAAGEQRRAAVLGAGSWGTALAILLARNNVQVALWGHDADFMAHLVRERCNRRYLPDVEFPAELRPEPDLAAALRGASDVLIVVPSHGFRAVLERALPFLGADARLAWGTKGLESGTGRLLHESVDDVLPVPHPYAVVSGPTFAGEVARGLPTAITVASHDERYAAELADLLHNESLRAYTSLDVSGVELGGAVKNVLAIAAGISDGLGFGANSRAALITRGLTEIIRLGVALGGRPETFMGLAGLGDLVLTCTDDQSRNRRFGLALARDVPAQTALREIAQVVEGAQTAREVCRLAEARNIEMPISQQVYRILYEGLKPRQAVQELFARELKPEFVAQDLG